MIAVMAQTVALSPSIGLLQGQCVKGKAGDEYRVAGIVVLVSQTGEIAKGICWQHMGTKKLFIEDAEFVADQFKDGEYQL